MRNTFLILAMLWTLHVCGQSKEAAYAFNQRILQHMEQHHFDSIAAHFDSTVSRYLSAEQLQLTVEGLTEKMGDIKDFGKTDLDSTPGLWISETMINFEKGKMSLRVSLNDRLQIAGIFIRPNSTYSAPEYVNTLAFVEYKVPFGKAPYLLQGQLTVPRGEGPFPCVVIVGGSGPTDKDMTVGNNKPYKDLAWGLANKGIAVLRYDKRTFLYGAQLMQDKEKGKFITIKEEYLDDVDAAVDALSKNVHVDKNNIFVLGHSQGGMLAPLIAKQNKKIAGVIMMAANARSMQDLLIEQLNFLYKDMPLDSTQQEKVDALKRHALLSKDPNLDPKTPDDSLPGSSAPYWISLNRYRQVITAQQLKKPMLILQGERDYQVTMVDFDTWKHALERYPYVSLKSYPKLNHHFIEGEGKPNRAEYEKKGNIPEYVISDIAMWVKSLQAPKNKRPD